MTGRLGTFLRGLAEVCRGQGIRAGRQEQLDKLAVAMLCRRVHRREPAFLPGIDIRPRRDQQPTDLMVAIGCGAVERLDPLRVSRDRPDLRTGVDECPRHFELAEERGEMERREAIRGVRGRGRRIVVEPSAQAIEIAERRRLEDVELGIRGHQRIGHGPIRPIARQHQGRHAVRVAGRSPGPGPASPTRRSAWHRRR